MLFTNPCFMFNFSEDRSYNFRARLKGFLFSAFGLLLPVLLLVDFIASSASKDFLNATLGAAGTDALHTYLVRTACLHCIRFCC